MNIWVSMRDVCVQGESKIAIRSKLATASAKHWVEDGCASILDFAMQAAGKHSLP